MESNDKVIMILTIGVVSMLGAIIIGEMFISHSRGTDVSTEVFTLIKMAVTGILGIIAGHERGKSVAIQQHFDMEKEEEDGSSKD